MGTALQGAVLHREVSTVLHSAMFSLIHLITAGSAYRLSTGMSKKPCKATKRLLRAFKL